MKNRRLFKILSCFIALNILILNLPKAIAESVTPFSNQMNVLAASGNSVIDAPARVEVVNRLGAEHAAPIGVNDFGDPGGTRFSWGNLIPGSGFEPIQMRKRWRVMNSGTENGYPWVELDGGGVTNYDLVTSGYLSGAEYRVYRIVDEQGQALPWEQGNLNITNADSYVPIHSGEVPPEGTQDLPHGGWVDTVYTQPAAVWGARDTLSFVDSTNVRNDETYYYTVVAINDSGDQYWNSLSSDLEKTAEVFATPKKGVAGNGPLIGIEIGEALNGMPPIRAGSWMNFRPIAVAATQPTSWELLDSEGRDFTLPDGLYFNTVTGELSGVTTTTPAATEIRLRLKAANGTVERNFWINPNPWTPSGTTVEPEPPTNLQAYAGDGYVHLTWDASPSSGVIGYKVYRANLPRSEQRRRVYLEKGGLVPVSGDYIHFDKQIYKGDPEWSHPRVATGRVEETWREAYGGIALEISRVPHTELVPKEMRFAGKGYMKIIATGEGTKGAHGPYIFYPENGGGESQWYSVLEPGKTYAYEAWMRQEGLANGGTVRLGFLGQYDSLGHNFTVDNTWRLHRFTFTAPDAPINGMHGAPAVEFTAPGTLYMDNIRLFRIDSPEQADELFVPSPLVFDRLMESQPETGEKGMLRGMETLLRQSSMESLLTPYPDDGITYDWYQASQPSSNMSLPAFLNYAYKTGNSPDTRMKPWLNVSSNASEEEWLALMEYLAAPINPEDPADVASKPYAYLRYQIRGVTTPWTEEFSRIFIEFANETWHNGMVSSEWFGWGATNGVMQGSKEFGLVSRYYSELLAEQSPWFEEARNNGQMKLVMGSNYSDYAEVGLPSAPLVDGIGHTTYVGPRWEANEAPNTVFNDHGVQATLLGHIADLAPNYFENYRRTRESLAEQGIYYELLGYEGGPSGYSLPGTVPEEQVDIGEQYGKSQAMAVAALDAWLGANQIGVTEQAFLSFAQGSHWSSHTPIANGFRDHVSWLALMMRNRYASGQMVTANVVESPVLEWAGDERPLIGAYAFRDKSKLAIFLLSRKLDGQHDGHDFGDGSTPVTLVLPGNPTGPATLYSISGNPRGNNRTAENITMQQQSYLLNGETVVNVPSGGIYLFVVDTDLPSSNNAPERVKSISINNEAGRSTITWPSVTGASGYRVYRSSIQGFNRAEAEDVFTVSTNEFIDTDAVGSSTFYYRIAAINQWGEGLESLVAKGGKNPLEAPYSAPTLLPTGIGDGQLLLSWKPIEGALGYRLGIGIGSGALTWQDMGDKTEKLVNNLTNGTEVRWTVQGYGAKGNGIIAKEALAVPRLSSVSGDLVAWNFDGMTSYESEATAHSKAMALDISSLSRGPGFEANEPPYHPLDNMFGFIPKDDGGNFGADGGGVFSNAVERQLYLTFEVKPREGYSIDIQRIKTGGRYPYTTHPETPLQVQLSYQVGDGEWTNVAGSHSIVSGYSAPTTDITLDLSQEVKLQNLKEVVKFRLYVYSSHFDHRYCRAGLMRSSGDDVIVEGTWDNYDLSGDGVVTVLDLAIIAQLYGKESTDSAFNIKMDFNGDGIIDIYDLIRVSKLL